MDVGTDADKVMAVASEKGVLNQDYGTIEFWFEPLWDPVAEPRRVLILKSNVLKIYVSMDCIKAIASGKPGYPVLKSKLSASPFGGADLNKLKKPENDKQALVIYRFNGSLDGEGRDGKKYEMQLKE